MATGERAPGAKRGGVGFVRPRRAPPHAPTKRPGSTGGHFVLTALPNAPAGGWSAVTDRRLLCRRGGAPVPPAPCRSAEERLDGSTDRPEVGRARRQRQCRCGARCTAGRSAVARLNAQNRACSLASLGLFKPRDLQLGFGFNPRRWWDARGQQKGHPTPPPGAAPRRPARPGSTRGLRPC